MSTTTKRTATMSPDRLWVGISAIALVTIIMLASYVFSFNAITEAAAWTGNPQSTHWLAAVFIDGAILTYTLSYAVFRWRGDVSKRTLIILYVFTGISVAVNFAHTASFWDWDFTSKEAIFGVLIAITAPTAALFASEEVVRLAFTKHGDVAAAAAVAEPEVEPEPLVVADEPAPADAEVPDLFDWASAERPPLSELEIFGDTHGYVGS